MMRGLINDVREMGDQMHKARDMLGQNTHLTLQP
jgi:hypothetical protein